MVRHNNELVQQEPAFHVVLLQNMHEQPSHVLGLENGSSPVCDRGNKKSADFLRSKFHESPGLKPVILTDLTSFEMVQEAVLHVEKLWWKSGPLGPRNERVSVCAVALVVGALAPVANVYVLANY